jgi:hypothetical protein
MTRHVNKCTGVYLLFISIASFQGADGLGYLRVLGLAITLDDFLGQDLIQAVHLPLLDATIESSAGAVVKV